MRFNYIIIKNFKRYGDYDTRFDLNVRDTRLLIGENGAGKTSFIDAIIWGIYGRSICAIDEVVNRQTKKDCKVEINFDIGPENYSIIRYRNHSENGNKLLLFKDRENISRRTINDTQDLIDEKVQINYNALVSSMVFSSEIYTSFLRAKVADRLKIFDSILSLKEIQDYYEAVKELRKPISDSIVDTNLNSEKLKSEIQASISSIEEYRETTKKKLIEFKITKDKIQEEIEKIKIDLDVAAHIDFEKELESNRAYNEAIEINRKLQEEIKLEEKHLIDTNKIIDEMEKCKRELEEASHIDVEFEINNLKLYKEIERNNLDIENEILVLKNKIAKTKEKEKILDFHEEEINEIKAEIEKINADIEICITCGQKVTAEFSKSLIEKKLDRILEIEEDIDAVRAGIESAIANNTSINNKIRDLSAKKKNLPNPSKFSEKYLSDLERNKEYLRNQISISENSFKEKEVFNNSIHNRINSLKNRMIKDIPQKSKYENSYLEWLKTSAKEQGQKISSLEKEIELINERAKTIYDKTYIETMNKKIEVLNTSLAEFNTKVKDLKKEDFHYEILQQLFSNKSGGIKKYVIEKMMNTFNEKINFYLPFFFDDDASITFDKDLNEVITINKNPVSFETFSSGEKTRFELAITFSLFMLVKTFFSTAVNLLVFDEILDQNLDKRGIIAVQEIIDNLGKENSILVISHREELKEYFGNQVNVIKDKDGFSRLI